MQDHGSTRGAAGRESSLPSFRRRFLFPVVASLLGCAIALVVAETAAAMLEPDVRVHGAAAATRDPELGWLPPIGRSTVTTGEFTAVYDVNALGMNDRPVEETLGRARRRVLALGDSHTFAVGVSQQETWPNVLEALLFGGDLDAGTVYNASVAGYSLGQYLVRFRGLEKTLDPQLVLIGFSMATDVYDLIPPRLGGFVYGADAGRVYFDLDEDGRLVEQRDLVGQQLAQDAARPRSASLQIRGFLERFALYRRLKKSGLAMAIATSGWTPGGDSLWPGPDTALRRELGPEQEYRWRLASLLLAEIAKEASGANRRVVLVNIPYLPQVYDEVWESSFGARPEQFDRWIAGRRLAKICEETGIGYIDTTPPLVEEARRRGEWLHYRQDGHPTPDGHRIIAQTVADGLRGMGLAP